MYVIYCDTIADFHNTCYEMMTRGATFKAYAGKLEIHLQGGF
jgi:hypothetical protein